MKIARDVAFLLALAMIFVGLLLIAGLGVAVFATGVVILVLLLRGVLMPTSGSAK